MSVHATDAMQVARRYTTAIFALAVDANKEAAVTEEFSVLAQAINGSEALADSLANPTVSNTQKAAVLAALMDKASALTRRAVDVVAKAGRASVIPVIADQLAAKLTEHQGELSAIITSARALPAATQKQLVKSLTAATGKAVTLTLKEDAGVLGGLSIQLGSLRLDATLAGALTTMREQLLASTH